MKANEYKYGLTHASLLAQLKYDHHTGRFTWNVNKPGVYARKGNRAGNIRGDGYRQIRVDGHLYLEHRLAWFYMNGVWPDEQVDHRTGDRSDNRWEQLRGASKSQNQANQNGHRHRERPYIGVDMHTRASGVVWRSSIRKDGLSYHLGYFQEPEDAYMARVVAELALYGDYAACLRYVP